MQGETHGYSSLETTNKEIRASRRISSSPANRDEDSGSRTLRETRMSWKSESKSNFDSDFYDPLRYTVLACT